MSYFSLLAMAAGAAIAIQASMNAKLGVLLKSAMMGTSIAFFVSCVFAVCGVEYFCSLELWGCGSLFAFLKTMMLIEVY